MPQFNRWQWLGLVMLARDLEPTDYHVAFWHYEHAEARTLMTYPSVENLAKLTNMSDRGVRKSRARLVDKGWLKPLNTSGGRARGAVYRLAIPSGLRMNPDHVEIKVAERLYRALETPNDGAGFDAENPEQQDRVSPGKPGTIDPETRNDEAETRNDEAQNPEPGFLRTSRTSVTSRTSGRAKRRACAHALPADWVLTPELRQSAEDLREKHKLAPVNLDLEVERFRNHAATNDRRCVRWNAAFLNWILIAKAPAQSNGNGAGRGNALREMSVAERRKLIDQENQRRITRWAEKMTPAQASEFLAGQGVWPFDDPPRYPGEDWRSR